MGLKMSSSFPLGNGDKKHFRASLYLLIRSTEITIIKVFVNIKPHRSEDNNFTPYNTNCSFVPHNQQVIIGNWEELK